MLQNVRCIPASDVSASEAAFQGVTVSSLAEHPTVHTSALSSFSPNAQGLPVTFTVYGLGHQS